MIIHAIELLDDEEKEEFARAFLTLLTLADGKMGGAIVGVVHMGRDDDPGFEHAVEYHVNIHSANLCAGDEEHTPAHFHPGSGTVQ